MSFLPSLPPPRSLRSLRRVAVTIVAAALAAQTLQGCTHSTSGTAPAGPATPAPSTSPAPAASRAGATLPGCPARPSGQSHWISGWLRACGPSLVDRRGREVRLLSLDMNLMGDGNGLLDPTACGRWHPLASYVPGDVRAWGFNSVELMVSWANIEPTAPTAGPGGRLVHHYDAAYLTALGQAVAAFHREGIAVILMMLQSRWSPAFRDLRLPSGRLQRCGIGMPQWLYPAGGGLPAMVRGELSFFRDAPVAVAGRHVPVQTLFADAWGHLAARFAHDPAVVAAIPLFEAYDLVAQPYPGAKHIRPSDLDLAGFYERIGAAIHARSPHVLIMVPDSRNRHTGRWGLTRRPDVPNEVYAFEYYPPSWSVRGRGRLQTYVRRARAWNLPLWISEFTAFGYSSRSGGHPGWQSSLRAMMAFTKRNDIGWTICCYAAGGFQTATDIRVPKPGLLPILRTGF